MKQEAPPSGTEGLILKPATHYEQNISHEWSYGAMARRLWEKKFKECADDAHDAKILLTGIGRRPEKDKLTVFPDGAIVAQHIDLKEMYGRVPKMLFLYASPTSAEGIVNLVSLAKEYKDQGVQRIICGLTSLAHERQDRIFVGKDGKSRRQVITLDTIIEMMSGHIDGVLLVGGHSKSSVRIGCKYKLPIIPIDPFEYMVHQAPIDRNCVGLVLRPDFGRESEGSRLAAYLGWPEASAEKHRDQEHDGETIITIPPEVLAYIKEQKCVVWMYDDEARTGDTTNKIAIALDGYAVALNLIIFKLICTESKDDKRFDGVANLSHHLIWQIIVSDAVTPMSDIEPIQGKMIIGHTEPEVMKLFLYLQHNFVRVGDPNWLMDSQKMGTQLHLDYQVGHER
jgi:hypothetical protein